MKNFGSRNFQPYVSYLKLGNLGIVPELFNYTTHFLSLHTTSRTLLCEAYKIAWMQSILRRHLFINIKASIHKYFRKIYWCKENFEMDQDVLESGTAGYNQELMKMQYFPIKTGKKKKVVKRTGQPFCGIHVKIFSLQIMRTLCWRMFQMRKNLLRAYRAYEHWNSAPLKLPKIIKFIKKTLYNV